MGRNRRALGLLVGSFIFGLSFAYSQTGQAPLDQTSVVSVEGRLTLEKHGEAETLVLHAKNAETYNIKGDLINQLKNSLIELGQNNLISVTGKQKKGSVYCEQRYNYGYNQQGEEEIKIDTQCIRPFDLEVTQVIFSKQSDEKMPPPKRDTEEEARMSARHRGREQKRLTPLVTGEIYGRVTAANLKSLIKTVEIANRDKNNPLQKIILIISSDTRVVKKIGEQEPIVLNERALIPGQEVTAVYVRDEFKTEAIAITITKE